MQTTDLIRMGRSRYNIVLDYIVQESPTKHMTIGSNVDGAAIAMQYFGKQLPPDRSWEFVYFGSLFNSIPHRFILKDDPLHETRDGQPPEWYIQLESQFAGNVGEAHMIEDEPYVLVRKEYTHRRSGYFLSVFRRADAL